MQIRSLFAKDLRRPINGVVKADQLDEAARAELQVMLVNSCESLENFNI